MPRIADALVHLKEAANFLTLEAYRISADDPEAEPQRVEHFSLAEELERIDRAIGPTGKTLFAFIAADIRAAYTELLAAQQALKE